jgi:hypothetical protein
VEIEHDLTPEDVIAFQKFHLASPTKAERGLRRQNWIGIVFFGLLSLLGVAASLNGEWSIATVFAVIAFGGILLSTLFRRQFLAWQIRRTLRKVEYAKELGWRRMEISPEGLRITTDETTTTLKRSGVERLAGTNEHAFFYVSPNSAHILPRLAFNTVDEVWEFVDTARRYRSEARSAREDHENIEREKRPSEDTGFKSGERSDF